MPLSRNSQARFFSLHCCRSEASIQATTPIHSVHYYGTNSAIGQQQKLFFPCYATVPLLTPHLLSQRATAQTLSTSSPQNKVRYATMDLGQLTFHRVNYIQTHSLGLQLSRQRGYIQVADKRQDLARFHGTQVWQRSPFLSVYLRHQASNTASLETTS